MRCKLISYPFIKGLNPRTSSRSILYRPGSSRARLFTVRPPTSHRGFTHTCITSANVESRCSISGQHAVGSGGSAGHPPLEAPGMKKAYIALGSNMGDRIANIDLACDLLDQMGIKVKRTSSLWETDPMYVTNQDKFLNGVCEVETALDPIDLLDILQLIEKNMGRVKVVDKGPRIIDLDIVMYEKEIVNTERLTLPHALAHEREFVLRPLAELCPGEPLNPKTPWKLVADYLEELPPSPMPLTTVTPVAPNLILRGLDPRRKTHIMGIVNMTPDSFSGDGMAGLFWKPHSAMYTKALTLRFEHMIRSGATILDIGGQSTRPNAPYIPGEEEKQRVLPAIQVARDLPAVQSGDVAISIDTFSSAVAMAALGKGTHLLNDVSAGTLSGDRMLHLAARKMKTIVLMHMRGNPVTMGRLNKYTAAHDPLRNDGNEDNEDEYQDEDAMIYTIAVELLARVAAAEEAGVRRWHIILDPGLGFAKHGARQNIALLRRLPELREWPGLVGLPWMVGPSRKSFLSPFIQKNTSSFYAGKFQATPNTHERIYATAAAVSACVEAGADIVRVHDVRAMSEVAAVSDGIWRGRISIAPTYTAPQHDDRVSINDVVTKNQPDENDEEKSVDFMAQVEENEKKSGFVPFDEHKHEERHQEAIMATHQLLKTVHNKTGSDGKPILPPPSWRSVKRQIIHIIGPNTEDKFTFQSLRKAYQKIIRTSSEFTGQPPPPPTAADAKTDTKEGKTKAEVGNEGEEKPFSTAEEVVREAMKKPVYRIKKAMRMDPVRLARSTLLQEQRSKLRALARAAKAREAHLRRLKIEANPLAPTPPAKKKKEYSNEETAARQFFIQANIRAAQRAKEVEEATRELQELDRQNAQLRVMTSQRLLRALRSGAAASARPLRGGRLARGSSVRMQPISKLSEVSREGELADVLQYRPPGNVVRKIKSIGLGAGTVDPRVLDQTMRQLQEVHRLKEEEKKAIKEETERKKKEPVRFVGSTVSSFDPRILDQTMKQLWESPGLKKEEEKAMQEEKQRRRKTEQIRFVDRSVLLSNPDLDRSPQCRPGDLMPVDWVNRRMNSVTSSPAPVTIKHVMGKIEETEEKSFVESSIEVGKDGKPRK